MNEDKNRAGKNVNKKAIILGLTGLSVLAIANARAATFLDVGLGSTDVIGEVVPHLLGTGQEARDMIMTTTLVNMYNAGTPSSSPYFISGNSFPKPLPLPTTVGDIVTPATGIHFAADGNVTITLSGASHYLLAAYDGPNSGAVLWDISGFAAGTTIEIPANAQPNATWTDLVDGKYGITSWSIFNGTSGVPDGGTTVALLGATMAGLGLIRRKLS